MPKPVQHKKLQRVEDRKAVARIIKFAPLLSLALMDTSFRLECGCIVRLTDPPLDPKDWESRRGTRKIAVLERCSSQLHSWFKNRGMAPEVNVLVPAKKQG